jgi:choline dehydrogenase
MVAERGEPVDYDRWAGQFGLDAWSWSGVQPWFDRIALPLHRAATSGPLGDALLAAEPNARRALLARSSDGVRESTNVGYLEPVRQRPNLTIEGDAIVDTVLLDGRRACGVRLAGGREVSAATVVVCGGAIASPVLLLRSGVHRRGIGANLQDHLGVAIPLDLAVGAEETVPDISVTARQGDLQLMAMDRVDGQPPSFGLLLGGVLATHSRGHVTLDGDGPLVSLDLLHDERDRESLAAVTAWAGRVLEHPAMRAVGARSAPPDPDAVVYWHAAGTCRMGRADDDLAVVDGEGRVHGYDGLLVADASVMPFLPQAGTMLPTVMIAERIASWLGRRLSG